MTICAIAPEAAIRVIFLGTSTCRPAESVNITAAGSSAGGSAAGDADGSDGADGGEAGEDDVPPVGDVPVQAVIATSMAIASSSVNILFLI